MLQKNRLTKKVVKKSNKQFNRLHFFAVEKLTFLKELRPHFKKKPKKLLTEEQKTKQKAKKKRLLNILMIVLNVVVLGIVLAVSLTQQDIGTVLAPYINWSYMGVVILLVAALILIDTIKIYILIKASTKKSRPFLSYKVSALGRYYDAVTPMSSGGQPFQMVYMNKRGIKGDVATSIPLMKYIFWQITYVIICTVVLIVGKTYGIGTNIATNTLAWIVILINLLLLLTVLTLSVSKKVGPLVVIWCLKLLSKMRIVKNYKKSFRRVMRFVINYQKTIKYFAKNFFVMAFEILLAFADTFLYNIIPYFIYRAFLPVGVVPSLTLLEVFIYSIICNLTTSIFPTPGASGGADAMFSIIFSGAFSESGMFWPLLTWRISNYYIYLVQGFFVLVYDFAVGNKKAEKLKENGALANAKVEISSFKEELNKNRDTIDIVSTQEEDKLPTSSFINMYSSKPTDEDNEKIIQGSDIASAEEMQQGVSPAEKVLKEVRVKDIQRRKARRLKKRTKIERRKSKNNK